MPGKRRKACLPGTADQCYVSPCRARLAGVCALTPIQSSAFRTNLRSWRIVAFDQHRKIYIAAERHFDCINGLMKTIRC